MTMNGMKVTGMKLTMVTLNNLLPMILKIKNYKIPYRLRKRLPMHPVSYTHLTLPTKLEV